MPLDTPSSSFSPSIKQPSTRDSHISSLVASSKHSPSNTVGRMSAKYGPLGLPNHRNRSSLADSEDVVPTGFMLVPPPPARPLSARTPTIHPDSDISNQTNHKYSDSKHSSPTFSITTSTSGCDPVFSSIASSSTLTHSSCSTATSISMNTLGRAQLRQSLPHPMDSKNMDTLNENDVESITDNDLLFDTNPSNSIPPTTASDVSEMMRRCSGFQSDPSSLPYNHQEPNFDEKHSASTIHAIQGVGKTQLPITSVKDATNSTAFTRSTTCASNSEVDKTEASSVGTTDMSDDASVGDSTCVPVEAKSDTDTPLQASLHSFMSTPPIRNDMTMSSSQGKTDIDAVAVDADQQAVTAEEIPGVDEDPFTEGLPRKRPSWTMVKETAKTIGVMSRDSSVVESAAFVNDGAIDDMLLSAVQVTESNLGDLSIADRLNSPPSPASPGLVISHSSAHPTEQQLLDRQRQVSNTTVALVASTSQEPNLPSIKSPLKLPPSNEDVAELTHRPSQIPSPISAANAKLRGMAGLRHSRMLRGSQTTQQQHQHQSVRNSYNANDVNKPEWHHVTDTDRQSRGIPHFQSAMKTRLPQSSFHQQRSDRRPQSLGTFTSGSIPSAATPRKDRYSGPSPSGPSPRGSSTGSTQRQWLVRSPPQSISTSPKSSPYRSKIPSSPSAQSPSRQTQQRVRGAGRLSVPAVDPSARLSAGLSSGRRLSASYRRGSVGTSPLQVQQQQSQRQPEQGCTTQAHDRITSSPNTRRETEQRVVFDVPDSSRRAISEVAPSSLIKEVVITYRDPDTEAIIAQQDRRYLTEGNVISVDRTNEINTTENAYDLTMYDGEAEHHSLPTSPKSSDGAGETKHVRIQEVGQQRQVAQLGYGHRNGQAHVPSPMRTTRIAAPKREGRAGLTGSSSARGIRNTGRTGRNATSRASIDGHAASGVSPKQKIMNSTSFNYGTSSSAMNSNDVYTQDRPLSNSNGSLGRLLRGSNQQQVPLGGSIPSPSSTPGGSSATGSRPGLFGRGMTSTPPNNLSAGTPSTTPSRPSPATAPAAPVSRNAAVAAMAAGASSVRRMLSFTPERKNAGRSAVVEDEGNTSIPSPAGRTTTNPNTRAKVTVPKPFALSGEMLQHRTQMAIEEARRRTLEVESRRRVFKARPMPDFSKPFPPPKNAF